MSMIDEMTLVTVAKQLELLEETLIYRFLERVQFAFHQGLYLGLTPKLGQNLQSPKSEEAPNTRTIPKIPKGTKAQQIPATWDCEVVLRHSLLGHRLAAHETMELQFGRYDVVEEFPFSPLTLIEGQQPLLASQAILQKLAMLPDRIDTDSPQESGLPLSLPRIREIGQNRKILCAYLDFLANYCPQTADLQYGSALEHDVMVLQAISRRIHYGAIYVAEIKFRQQQNELCPLILQWQQGQQPDCNEAVQQRILTLITRPEVEQHILQRVYDKAQAVQKPLQNDLAEVTAQAGSRNSKPPNLQSNSLHRHYLEPQSLRDFYANCIIPLTKQGELAYLYRRV